MAGALSVEATGETVGEAKWAALRELERIQPGLDKAAVRFEVVSEGERGLLGVGYAPARVVATVDEVERSAPPDESELAAEVRELVERIASTLGIACRVEVREAEGGLTATCVGSEIGVLIGRHGQTIDAAGYRERRRATLESLAVRSARRALDSGERIELDPMTAVERKVVHVRLKEYGGVETASEGTEPNRFVVIIPVE
jgi:spoIIIJ-associated protein